MEGLTLFVAVSRAGEPCFTIEITRVPFTLGASPRCDVVLDDPYVSRKHAVVTLTRGQLHYADTSSNGSFYRGQRVVNQLLGNGDTIEIHPFEVRFEYTLEDDEERRTALRGLDRLISPEVRERMQAPAPPPRPQPPPGPGTARPVEPREVSRPRDEAPGPGAPPVEEPRAEAVEAPGAETGGEAGGAATAAPESLDGGSAPTPPPAPTPDDEPIAPQVTMVPPGQAEPRSAGVQPGAADPPEPAPSQPPQTEEEEEEATAIVPPPPPISPRRPPVSRADDRPPLPRPADEPTAGEPEEEPPTIAFATVRPGPGPEDEVPPEQEGTVHMSMDRMVSLPPFSLEVVDGPPDQVGRTYPLPDREVTVGRGDQADFRLECDNISRLHASLSPQGSGEWLLRDLASLNGTFVGDQRITQVSLQVGVELRLANAITLRLVETEAPTAG